MKYYYPCCTDLQTIPCAIKSLLNTKIKIMKYKNIEEMKTIMECIKRAEL